MSKISRKDKYASYDNLMGSVDNLLNEESSFSERLKILKKCLLEALKFYPYIKSTVLLKILRNCKQLLEIAEEINLRYRRTRCTNQCIVLLRVVVEILADPTLNGDAISSSHKTKISHCFKRYYNVILSDTTAPSMEYDLRRIAQIYPTAIAALDGQNHEVIPENQRRTFSASLESLLNALKNAHGRITSYGYDKIWENMENIFQTVKRECPGDKLGREYLEKLLSVHPKYYEHYSNASSIILWTLAIILEKYCWCVELPRKEVLTSAPKYLEKLFFHLTSADKIRLDECLFLRLHFLPWMGFNLDEKIDEILQRTFIHVNYVEILRKYITINVVDSSKWKSFGDFHHVGRHASNERPSVTLDLTGRIYSLFDKTAGVLLNPKENATQNDLQLLQDLMNTLNRALKFHDAFVDPFLKRFCSIANASPSSNDYKNRIGLWIFFKLLSKFQPGEYPMLDTSGCIGFIRKYFVIDNEKTQTSTLNEENTLMEWIVLRFHLKDLHNSNGLDLNEVILTLGDLDNILYRKYATVDWVKVKELEENTQFGNIWIEDIRTAAKSELPTIPFLNDQSPREEIIGDANHPSPFNSSHHAVVDDSETEETESPGGPKNEIIQPNCSFAGKSDDVNKTKGHSEKTQGENLPPQVNGTSKSDSENDTENGTAWLEISLNQEESQHLKEMGELIRIDKDATNNTAKDNDTDASQRQGSSSESSDSESEDEAQGANQPEVVEAEQVESEDDEIDSEAASQSSRDQDDVDINQAEAHSPNSSGCQLPLQPLRPITPLPLFNLLNDESPAKNKFNSQWIHWTKKPKSAEIESRILHQTNTQEAPTPPPPPPLQNESDDIWELTVPFDAPIEDVMEGFLPHIPGAFLSLFTKVDADGIAHHGFRVDGNVIISHCNSNGDPNPNT